MKKYYIIGYILLLLAAIGYFVIGIIVLATKDDGRFLGINTGIIDILAGITMLVILLLAYNLTKEK